MSDNNFKDSNNDEKPITMDSPVESNISKNYEPNFSIPISSSPPKNSYIISSPLSSPKMSKLHRHKSSSPSSPPENESVNNANNLHGGFRITKSINENDNDGEENYTERVLEDEARKNNIMNKIKLEKLNRTSSFEAPVLADYSNKESNRVRTHSNHNITTFDESDVTTQDSLRNELKERGTYSNIDQINLIFKFMLTNY